MYLFMDGFDQYAPAGTTGDKVQQYLQANGYDVRNASAATFSIIDGRQTANNAVVPGQCALRFTIKQSSSVNASLSRTFSSQANKVVVGFAMRATGERMRTVRVENIIDVDWDTETGKLKVGEVLGASVLILNAWYYHELMIDWDAGTIEVWTNNERQLTVPTPQSKLTNYTVTWGQTGNATGTGVQDLDDFTLIDSSNGKIVDRVGPQDVFFRPPTADVKTEWSIVDGGGVTSHYQVAAQLLPGDTGKPYLQSNVAGAIDQFRSNAALPNNNEIYAVAVNAYARKGDLDDRSLGIVLQTGDTPQETEVKLTESFKYYQVTHEAPPSGGTWNQNMVESTEFGIVTR